CARAGNAAGPSTEYFEFW
nr:immunoglobulin heavy chain junction region [Macaca mulatta]MOX67899.1 immunoglobulin heavy chain junction region [Macaca mulatta]MOX68887.1 immunoglobulin heavy chain junction region [Macaca mulatta]